jgi:hypothetical protein
MKVEGSYEMVRTVMNRLLAQLRGEKAAIDAERNFYQELLRRVGTYEAKAYSLKLSMVEKLSTAYDNVARQSKEEFAEGLRMRELLRRSIPLLRDKDTTAWLHELKGRFEQSARKELEAESAYVSLDMIDEMRAMMEEIGQNLERRQERIRGNALLPQAAKHSEILRRLRSKLEGVRIDENLLKGTASETRDIRKLALAGGGLAGLGVIIVAISPIWWLDVTAGIFLATGFLLFLSGLHWRRSGMLRDFQQKLGDSRRELNSRLDSDFSQIFDGLFYEVRQALSESIFRLDMQASVNAPLLEETFSIGEVASDMVIVSQRIPIEQPQRPSVAA